MKIFLTYVAAVMLGNMFGMFIMCLFTSGKTSDLYSSIFDLKKENKKLKQERDSLLYTDKYKCTFDE